MTVTFVAGPGEEGSNEIDFWVRRFGTKKMTVLDHGSVRSIYCKGGSNGKWGFFVRRN